MPGALVALAVALIAAGPWATRGPAAAELVPPERQAAEVREAVREVLDRPEYRQRRPSLLARARAWVLERIARLLTTLLEGGRASAFGWVVVGLLLAAVAWFAWRFARGVTRDPEGAAAAPPRARRAPREWLAEAEAHEARGAWRAGLRCRYRALVAELADRGVVEEVPGRTAGEYRADVARAVPAAAGHFGGATELFELAWYGNRPTGPDEAGRFRSLAGRVAAAVGR